MLCKSRKSIYPCGFLIILSMIISAKCRDTHFSILYFNFARYKLCSVHRFWLSSIKDADKIENSTYKTASIIPIFCNALRTFFTPQKLLSVYTISLNIK